jgi:gamma-F420-2:alpha-L-glutamate ligase
MSAKPKTLWMVDRSATLYAPQRLQTLCNEQGFEFRFFNGSDFPSPATWQGSFPTAIFICLRDPALFLPSLKTWGSLGIKILNTPESIVIAADKFESNKMMAQAGIPVPKSVLLTETSDFDAVAKEFTLPVVVKGFPSGQGKHVYLAHSVDDLKKAFVEFKSECKGVMAQMLIPSSFGRDLRVLTFFDEVIGVGQRTAPAGTFAANVSSGARLEPFARSELIVSMALNTARAHGLQFSGVDLLFGPADDFYVCEINSAPAFFPPFEEVFGVDVGVLLLNALLN